MSKKIILVIDDEPYVVRSLSYILKREGYQVDSAFDGQTGLEKVKQLHPDLVFLDLHLPKMDGLSVCREIKSDPQIQNTHVIVLTGKGQEDDRKRGMEAGADEYLTKPFSPKELMEHLRKFFIS